MSGDKPKVLWRADGEGKCHQWCQQYNPPVGAMSACLLVRNLLPGVTEPDVGGKCPFAVLADVLCVHQPPYEAPMADLDLEHMMHLAWGCGYCFGRERPNDDHNEDIDRMNADVHSLIIHERSEVVIQRSLGSTEALLDLLRDIRRSYEPESEKKEEAK